MFANACFHPLAYKKYFAKMSRMPYIAGRRSVQQAYSRCRNNEQATGASALLIFIHPARGISETKEAGRRGMLEEADKTDEESRCRQGIQEYGKEVVHMVIQHSHGDRASSSATLTELEQQLVIEVLRLYRDGESESRVRAKIRELRSVRAQMRSYCP